MSKTINLFSAKGTTAGGGGKTACFKGKRAHDKENTTEGRMDG